MTAQAEQTLTVLVVDDDAGIREVLRSYLEQRGMHPLVSVTAEEALTRSDLDQVQVALLDIRLPGRIDGHGLQQELNRRFPDMAKILMSGNADLEDAIAAFADQAFSFVKKPFTSLREIGLLIERAAEAKRLEIENRRYSVQLEEANRRVSGQVVETTAEAQRYQKILTHLFSVSSGLARLPQPDSVLDFVCRAVVEAGAFRRAVILLADEKHLIRHAGVWQEGGVPEALRASLRMLHGKPMRPFFFDQQEAQIGPAVYFQRTAVASLSNESPERGWQPGDQLFLPVMREDGSAYGFLSLETPLDGARPAEDILRLVEVLMTQGALHVQSQEMRDELKRRAAELEVRVHERTRELRLSEERFSRLVNSTTDIVYVTDSENRLTFLNEAFTKTLGYVRENYLGRALPQMLGDVATENPINHRALRDLTELVGENTLHRVEVLTLDGDKRMLEINRTIARQGAEVTGTQGIIRDITEHRILLQQLVSSERMAATGRLATGVAHEINNPLQAMTSQLRALEARVAAGQEIRTQLDTLTDGIERIRSIVRSLLDLHRMAGRERSAVDLNESAKRILALVGQQMHERGIQAAEEFASELPIVMGSPQEIQQVILNLVVNSIEAMPNGGVLTVSTSVDAESVRLQVCDTGVGIPAEHLPQIFEPFFSFKPGESGTGLGLYLSKNIMELHNGGITAESEKGKGACFTLMFPRQ